MLRRDVKAAKRMLIQNIFVKTVCVSLDFMFFAVSGGTCVQVAPARGQVRCEFRVYPHFSPAVCAKLPPHITCQVIRKVVWCELALTEGLKAPSQ